MDTDPLPLSSLTSVLGFTEPLLLSAGLPSDVVFGLFAICLLLVCSALVSGAEVSYFSLSPTDIEKLAEENSVVSRRILNLKDKPRRLLATILISNNFVNIAIVLLSEYTLRSVLSEELLNVWAAYLMPVINWIGSYAQESVAQVIHFLITVVGVTFLLVLFGEASPKVYATNNRISLSRQMSAPLMFLMRIFHWPAELLVRGTNLIEKRLTNHTATVARTSREDIDEAIAITISGEVDGEQDSDILKRILKFRDVAVKQIMRSRFDLVAVDQQVFFSELLDIIRSSGYSRIPVYDENIDNVVGILYVKDLLGHLSESDSFRWQQLVRTNVLFIPEAKKIKDLLQEFQSAQLHMAIVVDEYGGTSGLITLEDILEEIIGDIKDEFDDEPEVIFEKLDDFNYIFDGRTMLNDVCRTMGISVDVFEEAKGEADSLAGMVLEILREFPENGEEVLLYPYRLKVVAVNERRIERILITLPSSEEL